MEMCYIGSLYVPENVKTLLRSMEMVSGAVPCTDASRRRMRQHLRSLQLWQGLPSVFLTLNPADTKHPFTCFFASSPAEPWQPVTSDAALRSALERVNLLHSVAADPVAVARAFHRHVELFLAELLDCHLPADKKSPDGLAVISHGGILGPVAAYFGVTEPQLRGSLHLHMLLHLYAFSTPSAFAAQLQNAMPLLAQRLTEWASTLVSTSLEALPRVWNLPGTPSSHFESLQPLPYSKHQLQRILQGAPASWDFAAAEARWFYASPDCCFEPVPPWADPFDDAGQCCPPFLPWPRRYVCSSLCVDDWSCRLLYDLRHSAVQCCLHDCKPRSCHKGFLGRLGFCRLGYWHWRELPDCRWQRCHGLPLRSAAGVGALPPHDGFLLTERHHPYHTRFHPAILATSKCNHDISLLVRCPREDCALDAAAFAAIMASSTQVATYYITAYISKVQPHLVSLWQLLQNALDRLRVDLSAMETAVAEPLSQPYVARRVLTRMLTATQRQVHKSLPEICHYLLGFPEAYCSHTFRLLLKPSNSCAQYFVSTFRLLCTLFLAA